MNVLVPQWPAILGVLTAVWLVFGWAIYAHQPAQVPGRHRPESVTVPDVFARVLASEPETDVLPFWPGPNYRDILDDWTTDLPTQELPVITGQQLLADDTAVVVNEPPRHTSPTERARERWGVECPIFAALADQYGYEPGGTFTELAAA